MKKEPKFIIGEEIWFCGLHQADERFRIAKGKIVNIFYPSSKEITYMINFGEHNFLIVPEEYCFTTERQAQEESDNKNRIIESILFKTNWRKKWKNLKLIYCF